MSFLRDYIKSEPYRGSLSSPVAATPVQQLAPQLSESSRNSWIFDTHIMSESSGAGGKNPQAVSLSWDEGRAWGYNTAPQSWMGMTPRERKETLLSIFLANPWASNCIDTIALYIISGGFTIEPTVPNPDKSQRVKIDKLLKRINDDWDFNQYVYDQITDELIFGESFTEFTLYGGAPYQIFPIDCLTMDTECDQFGRILQFKQQLTSTTKINFLKPDKIVRWWNPHKRAKVDPFSPLERVQDAILLDKKMVNWLTTFFQKGAKYNYYFKGLGDNNEAERFLAYFKQNFTGEKNAQTPPVLWGNAEIAPLGNAGPLDMDFDKGMDRMQSIILSAFHVPPSIACIAEVGNRLSDMSDGQRKILQYIACDPKRHRFFEKFNYRLIAPYFGTDYYVSTRYADFRDDKTLAEVHDIKIRNGSLLIDESRQESGKDPYPDGSGSVPIIITTKEVTPVSRVVDLEDEQRQTAQVTLDTAKANADLAQTKAKQAKEPPPPVAGPLQIAQPPQQKPKDGKKQESVEGQPQTGMMLALLPDQTTAQLLALPGGEPVEDLHITLAYLGEMTDDRTQDQRYADREPETIKRLISTVASTYTPLFGGLAGFGRFTAATAEQATTPVIALVDVPRLTELRTELVEALKQANYFVAENHGYTAHITLAYIDADTPMPIDTMLMLPLFFNTVWLCIGDERIPFALGGGPQYEDTTTTPQSETLIEQSTGQEPRESDGPLSEALQDTDNRIRSHDPQESQGASDAPQEHGIDGQEAPSKASWEKRYTVFGDLVRSNMATNEMAFAYRAFQEDAESEPDQRKQELAATVAALFLLLPSRIEHGSLLTTTAITAYVLSHDDQAHMQQAIAESYLAAQAWSYLRVAATTGIESLPGIASTLSDALAWAREQVSSIVGTLHEQLTNFIGGLPGDLSPAAIGSQLKEWIANFADYKSTQIANVAWGTGVDVGANAALTDILEAATDPSQADIPTDNIRVRVLPSESSSDACKEYAGNDYAIDEYFSLQVHWPMHPNCPHYIEAYMDMSGTDASTLAGDDVS